MNLAFLLNFVKVIYVVFYCQLILLFQEKSGENGNVNTSVILVHKLVSVLESIEKLPIYLYDSPGSCYGLQVCFRFVISVYGSVAFNLLGLW